MGSKSRLQQVMTGKNGVNSVLTQGLKWRMGWDSNPRNAFTFGGFQDRYLKPLGHPSGASADLRVARGIAALKRGSSLIIAGNALC